jgi:hypothetical protein
MLHRRRGGGGRGGRLKGADLVYLEHGRLPVEALRLGLREQQTRREERLREAGRAYIVVIIEVVRGRRRRLGRRRDHWAPRRLQLPEGIGNLAELGGQMGGLGRWKVWCSSQGEAKKTGFCGPDGMSLARPNVVANIDENN